jgi:hypothetical protein
MKDQREKRRDQDEMRDQTRSQSSDQPQTLLPLWTSQDGLCTSHVQCSAHRPTVISKQQVHITGEQQIFLQGGHTHSIQSTPSLICTQLQVKLLDQ